MTTKNIFKYLLAGVLLMGGTNATSNPSKYTIEASSITLAYSSRVGSTFSGWTYTGQTSPQKRFAITDGSTGDKTHKANGMANQYIVTFNANGGSVSKKTKKVTYGTTYGAFPTPIRADYTFTGWYTSASDDGIRVLSSSLVTITSDQTLYAHWKPYVLSYKNQNGYKDNAGNYKDYISYGELTDEVTFNYSSSYTSSDNVVDFDDTWQFLGKLTSNNNYDSYFKVGLYTTKFTVKAEPYTTVGYQFGTSVSGSPNKGGSESQPWPSYGSEIICCQDYTLLNQLAVKADKESESSVSNITKDWSEGYSGGTHTKSNTTSNVVVLVDNRTGSSTSTQNFDLGLKAFTQLQSGQITSTFWYKKQPVITYYATVTYHDVDGNEVGDAQEIQSTSTEDYSNKLRSYTGSGRLIGWSKVRNSGTIDYMPGATINPYNSKTKGGLGLIPLYPIIDNSASSEDKLSTKIGNTVSVKGSANGTLLRNSSVSGSNYASWFHEQVPFQLMAYRAVDTETGLPTTSANNLSEDSNNRVSVASGTYLSVVLPYGYRVLSYSLTSSSTDATLERYQEGYTATASAIYSASAMNSGVSESFSDDSHVNKLYFHVTNGSLSLDDFMVTYAVDAVVNGENVVSLPKANGTSTYDTGVYDFGTLSNSSYTAAASDAQAVSVYQKSGSTTTDINKFTTVHSKKYYRITANGNYYVEAPKGYRIVAANASFNGAIKITKLASTAQYSGDNTSEISDNVFDGIDDTKWCSQYQDNYAYVTFMTSAPTQMNYYQFLDAYDTFHQNPDSGSPYTYTWRHWKTWKISASNDQSSWTTIHEVTSDNPSTTADYSHTFTADELNTVYNGNYYQYYKLEVTSTINEGRQNNMDDKVRQQMADLNFEFNVGNSQSSSGSSSSTTYSYDVYTSYGRSLKTSRDLNVVGMYNTNPQSVTFSNPNTGTVLNNDAIEFGIAHLSDVEAALVAVDLTLMPLDPHVQNLQLTATASGSGYVCNAYPTVTDFKLNDGNTILLTAPGSAQSADKFTLALADANNEEEYTAGASNFYYIGSNYYKTTCSNLTSLSDQNLCTTTGTFSLANVNNSAAKKISSIVGNGAYSKLKFVTVSGSAVVQNDLENQKSNAHLIPLSSSTYAIAYDSDNKYYIYTADVPLYNLSSTAHIAYRAYEMNVKVQKSLFTPFVTVKTIYDDNNTDILDTKHRYVGVTVGGSTTGIYTGPCYITVDNDNIPDDANRYLKAERIPNQDALQSASLEDASLWNFEQYTENGTMYYKIYTVNAQGQKIYLACKNDNGQITESSIGIDTKAPTTGFILTSEGYLSMGTGYNAVLCLDQNANGYYWQYNTKGSHPQYERIKFVNTTGGYLASADVIDAIKSKLAEKKNNEYQYTYNINPASEEDLCKGVLYVDMSSLVNITETTTSSGNGSWSNFQGEVADNAVFFMPYNCTGSFTKNSVCKDETGNTFISASNFDLTDKVPFFTPRDFNTGKWSAMFTRQMTMSGTDNGESVLHSTLMLPFVVTNSQSTIIVYDGEESTCNMSFCNLGTYTNKTVQVNPISGATEANKPYHIMIAGDQNSLYKITEIGAQVSQTPEGGVVESIMDGGIWTAHASYYGQAIPAAAQGVMYYYSKGLYWDSNVLYGNTIKFLPFRACFYKQGVGTAKTLHIGFEEDCDDLSGIETVAEEESSASQDIYTISGIKVNGMPSQHGIYIVNGKKVLY